jgi:SAM-dependent methyltransferase
MLRAGIIPGQKVRKYLHRDKKRLLETRMYKQTGALFELGFGPGGFLLRASQYFDVSGMDRSDKAAARMKSSLKEKGTVKQGDIEKEDLGLDRFDVVAAFNVLEHLREPARTIEKIYRSLHKTGILIGSVPNNCYVLGKLYTNLTNLVDKTHCSTYPTNEWRSIFEDVGFTEINFFGEVLFTQYVTIYLRNYRWAYRSLNLMFVCRK